MGPEKELDLKEEETVTAGAKSKHHRSISAFYRVDAIHLCFARG
jgi:hypothetical protein